MEIGFQNHETKKNFPAKKNAPKVDFSDYDNILANFDQFCDEFESRASNAYMKGDQNDGRVIGETERIGEDTPMAVREVEQPGPAPLQPRIHR